MSDDRHQLSGINGARSGIVDEFLQQGFVQLRSVLTAGNAAELRDLIERRHSDPVTYEDDRDFIRGGVSLMRMFEYNNMFRDLLILEPIISIVENILGPDCHIVAQNALRTPKGQSIVRWHIDDALFFPFLHSIASSLSGETLQLPCYSLNVMIALTDVDEERFGPTQVVPESHLSGTLPEYDSSLPKGIKTVSLLARAGDAYLINSQTWHRGAPNQSERTRYILTTTWGRRFISQRFYPFLNYQMPAHVLDGASERLLRALGRHDKGAYG